MTAYRLDTAAAIRALEDAGVEKRQAAAIVGLHADADADLVTKADLALAKTELKADIDGLRTELKADNDNLSQRVDANQNLLRQQMETGFANLATSIADGNTAQQRRFNAFLGALVAVAAVVLAGLAVF